jgi:hypothetical protein
MNAYTSLRVTRSKAKQELINWILGEVDDKKLEDFMDQLLEHRLYNAVIVPDDAPNDDDAV